MVPTARLMDTTFGVCTGHKHPISASGYVITSQVKVLINGMPAARMIDTVIASCGHTGTIIGGSGKVFINGIPSARAGDSFVGTYSGTITGGSGNVFCA